MDAYEVFAKRSPRHSGDEKGNVVVRRAGNFSSSEIHQALFPNGLKNKAAADVKAGIRKYIRQRHAGR